jgi:hypothetical protein
MWYCLILAVPLIEIVGWVFRGDCIRKEESDDDDDLFEHSLFEKVFGIARLFVIFCTLFEINACFGDVDCAEVDLYVACAG